MFPTIPNREPVRHTLACPDSLYVSFRLIFTNLTSFLGISNSQGREKKNYLALAHLAFFSVVPEACLAGRPPLRSNVVGYADKLVRISKDVFAS